MKKFVKENWFKIVILLILASLFFWYEWRPVQIKKECFKKASDFSTETMDKQEGSIDSFDKIYDFMYKNCLRKEGL